MSDEKLRGAGLSNSKVKYLKNVADHFIEKRIETSKVHTMSDEELIDNLTSIKGVGVWTVNF